MTRGLMGPRDVHKRVLDVPWPTYDPTQDVHLELARISRDLASWAESQLPTLPRDLGRARRQIREHLPTDQRTRMEQLVEAISDSTTPR